jgi:hypothetical protein
LADGSTKPIATIEVGDVVLATDPETGETSAESVTATWAHQDVLVDLSVDGMALTTTEDHVFWNATDELWQEIGAFAPGDRLLTPSGETVTVTGLSWATTRLGPAYNLTVEHRHTYYVMVGATPVLVHNDGGDRFDHLSRPGFTNYLLLDRTGRVYYSGIFGPGDTAAKVQYRHSNNRNRFDRANGDTMRLVPGTRTYGEARLMEQRLADQHGTVIGRDGANYRGNRQNPLDSDKTAEYEEYERGIGGDCT